jgi:hypothetical protein
MRETFVLRTEWYSNFEELEVKDKAELLDAIFLYNLDRESEINFTSPMSKMCWNFIRPTIDYHNKRYHASVENGKKGGAPKGNNNAKKQPKLTQEEPKTTQEQPIKNNYKQPKNNLTDTVTVIDTDIDIVNDIEIDTVFESEIKDLMKSKKLSRTEAIKYINGLPSVEEIFIKAEEKRKEIFGVTFDDI